jgi:hypothetical protein
MDRCTCKPKRRSLQSMHNLHVCLFWDQVELGAAKRQSYGAIMALQPRTGNSSPSRRGRTRESQPVRSAVSWGAVKRLQMTDRDAIGGMESPLLVYQEPAWLAPLKPTANWLVGSMADKMERTRSIWLGKVGPIQKRTARVLTWSISSHVTAYSVIHGHKLQKKHSANDILLLRP